MQGNIDFTGSLSGSIAGGGGGGTDVTITPTLEDGTKIADYTIGSESGSLYAPTPEGLAADLPLYISNNTIYIDLSAYDTSEEIAAIYATKASVNAQLLADRQYEDLTFQRIDRMTDYQPKLTAGENITIDADNVISASGGGVINYSTAEQDTGELWIDGISHVYQKSFQATLSGNAIQIDLTGLNISKAWIKDGFYDIGVTCLALNEYLGGTNNCYCHINTGLTPPHIDCANNITSNSTIYITIKYIKNSV